MGTEWTFLKMYLKVLTLLLFNPPDIRTEVIQGLEDEVKLHDPWIALDGHEDGLYFYRRKL